MDTRTFYDHHAALFRARYAATFVQLREHLKALSLLYDGDDYSEHNPKAIQAASHDSKSLMPDIRLLAIVPGTTNAHGWGGDELPITLALEHARLRTNDNGWGVHSAVKFSLRQRPWDKQLLFGATLFAVQAAVQVAREQLEALATELQALEDAGALHDPEKVEIIAYQGRVRRALFDLRRPVRDWYEENLLNWFDTVLTLRETTPKDRKLLRELARKGLVEDIEHHRGEGTAFALTQLALDHNLWHRDQANDNDKSTNRLS